MHDCVTDRVVGGKRAECADCLAADLEKTTKAWALAADERDKRGEELKAALLQIDDLKDSLGHREAQLNEALAKVQESNRLNEVLQKFYDWYQNAGSWSNVSFNPEDGCRWILKPDEHLEGERLSDAIDALLSKTEKRVRLCDAIPPGGGQPCMKEPGHGGVCENEKDVWDWKPKHRHEK